MNRGTSISLKILCYCVDHLFRACFAGCFLEPASQAVFWSLLRKLVFEPASQAGFGACFAGWFWNLLRRLVLEPASQAGFSCRDAEVQSGREFASLTFDDCG